MNKFSSEITDQEIISSVLDAGVDNEKAENSFFDRYDYFIKQGMRKYGMPENAAFDAYSDTIFVVFKNIRKGRFYGHTPLKAYTFQIFQDKYFERTRKKSTGKNSTCAPAIISDFMQEFSANTKSTLQRLSENADWDLLREELALLSDPCKKMLDLFANGHPDRELTDAFGYETADAVKVSRLHCLETLHGQYTNEPAL